MKSILKNLAKNLKQTIIDYYYDYQFYQHPHNYKGVFQTFEEALNAIPKKFNPVYNDLFETSLFQEIEAGKNPHELINDQDYAVIFWLKSILKDGLTLLDLGGNLGLAYYSYGTYLNYPDNFKWTVFDREQSIESAKKLAQKVNNSDKLSFITDLKDADQPDILLTGGTLQYLEKSLATIMEEFKLKPKDIIVQRVPCYEGKTYITLQNLGSSAVPYKIQNRQQLINEISNLGYELIDSWKIDRTCYIPFHPECFVEGYHGFYFRRKS